MTADARFFPVLAIPGGTPGQILVPNGDNTAAWGTASNGEMVYKGAIDASTSPNYPAARMGDVYSISVDGLIGGAAGPIVLKNDTLIAIVDTPAGDHATVGGNWDRNGDRKAPLVTTLLSGTGTYLIPTGTMTLLVQMQAAGSGGGSGRRGAAASARGGGNGGSCGAFTEMTFVAAELIAAQGSSTIFYNVGVGGAGAPAVAVNDTNGTQGSGTTAGISWIGQTATLAGVLYGLARMGSGGGGGTTATGSIPVPMTGSTPQGNFQNLQFSGAGGGISAADAAFAGSNGNSNIWSGQSAGLGGIVGGASPTSGTPTGLLSSGPYPGGGAASITTAAQAGANGLANSGAGGGGGGASLNGNNSGAGGTGGSGFIRIIAYR